MREGSRSASTMPGGQCVMIFGIVLMLQWSAGSWDMQPLDVRLLNCVVFEIAQL